MTLPESVISGLSAYDDTPGGAVVKLFRSAQAKGQGGQRVEVVEVARETGLIVIGPAPTLKRIDFLHLVEVAPGRFLLALDPGHDFRALELAIQDVLDEVDDVSAGERAMIEDLVLQIRRVRRSSQVRMAEILFVKLDGSNRA